MKTLTKTVFASLFTAVLLSTSAMATFAASPIQKTTAYAGFNKIWVSGNVKIVLTQSDQEEVQVGEDFNSEMTTIQSKGQTLYINSMESAQVTINVSVKDLQRIEAAGSSVVVTSNNFDVKYLQVFLSQSATAKVKTTAGSLYTVVNDDAVLRLNGSADEHTLIAANLKNTKLDNFVSKNSTATVIAMKAVKLAANDIR
ncbi:GIN domain-containing protein [Pedobacter metabolipauper]|uniref:Putative auto-transporter adhesin head GIN domain-containing protein n=1 Tax=Pedobacter metabolipauper TaxID=425513 RepID=A0A4R6SY00_9SPHI|nr:DUF2807 domain-containing protein [Pedobacter metabolipauper]TDQ10917.1 hypothetical protein ATK78_0025 [Pedobacter metabolipauper]